MNNLFSTHNLRVSELLRIELLTNFISYKNRRGFKNLIGLNEKSIIKILNGINYAFLVLFRKLFYWNSS